MNTLKRCGLVLAVLIFTTNTWAIELDTEQKKLGYIIGMDIGKSLKDQGTEVDLDSLVSAIRSTYNDEELAMTTEEAAKVRQEYIERRQTEQQAEAAVAGESNLVAGQKFLAENATKEGVQSTASGLQYKVITMGTGALLFCTSAYLHRNFFLDFHPSHLPPQIKNIDTIKTIV